MKTLFQRQIGTAFVLSALAGACSKASNPAPQPTPAPAPTQAAAANQPTQAAAAPEQHHMDSMTGMPGMSGMSGMDIPVRIPKGALYTAADVHFMQGMIAHHAQAIYMSRMAKTHGANPHVLELSTKIDQSQVAEIRLMQGWLRANGQVAPDTSSWRHVSMPGMLTADQIQDLESAKGKDFDHAYLTYMIQHHRGALKMVQDLFATPMAGQDIDVSVFANDVVVVQTAEINAMLRMLDAD